MLNPEWHTFPTQDLHSDAAVFQFQLLYEHLEVFRRQKWLGGRRLQPWDSAWGSVLVAAVVMKCACIAKGVAQPGLAAVWRLALYVARLLTRKTP